MSEVSEIKSTTKSTTEGQSSLLVFSFLSLSHSTGKCCCCCFTDLSAIEEKSPSHIHPQRLVPLCFLRNCSGFLYVSRCVRCLCCHQAQTAISSWLDEKKRNTNKPPGLVAPPHPPLLPAQFHCGNRCSHCSTSCQSLVSVWGFCNNNRGQNIHQTISHEVSVKQQSDDRLLLTFRDWSAASDWSIHYKTLRHFSLQVLMKQLSYLCFDVVNGLSLNMCVWGQHLLLVVRSHWKPEGW